MTTGTPLDLLVQPALSYDYSQILDAVARRTAQDAALNIKPRLRRAKEDIVVIGKYLTEAKNSLDHGHWLPWLADEFDMSDTSARNFMRVYNKFGQNSESIPDLTPTALYLLARPSTPDEAIEEVAQRIEQGAAPTVSETKKIIKEAKAPAPSRKESPWPVWGEEDLISPPPKPPAPASRSVVWDEKGYASYAPSSISVGVLTMPTDNAQLSVDDTDDEDMTWDTEPDTAAPTDPEDRHAAELQRLHLVSALAQSVATLCNPKLLAIAESYAYGIEFKRLCQDARDLHATFFAFTPDDRI